MRRTAQLFLGISALLVVVGQASAQEVQPIGSKSPGTATVISVIVPGGGQMYAEELGLGLTILGISTAAPLAGALTGSSGGVLAGLAVSVAAWVYGIVDAPRAARRHNAALSAVGSPTLTPSIVPATVGETKVGLTFTVRW